MPALKENAVTKIATITGIDAKSVASTTLYTPPSGKTFIPVYLVVRCTAFTAGSKSVQAVASAGGNSTSYNDFFSNQTFTVDALRAIKKGVDAQEVAILNSSTPLTLNITTASNATTETWAVDVFGYLV